MTVIHLESSDNGGSGEVDTPYEGLDIGKDARSPVSWDLYKKYRVFKYTGAIKQVKYVPGSPAPDAKE